MGEQHLFDHSALRGVQVSIRLGDVDDLLDGGNLLASILPFERKRPSNAPVNPRRLVLDLLHERKAGGNPATAQPGGSGSAG
jgi:hypothetical protein